MLFDEPLMDILRPGQVASTTARACRVARKKIPDDAQRSVLTKSRRRCCLCFWLDGCDEVQKGQIAHLDQDNENANEDNLAFLCFNHHDEYDGVPRLAKGLREDEVRHWRDELYREMEHRFRTVRKGACELTIVRFKWLGPTDEFKASFCLKNTGEMALRSPTVSIKLPAHVEGSLPSQYSVLSGGFKVPEPPDLWAAYESIQDIFEVNGRVAVQEMPGLRPVLMPDHSYRFEALVLHLTSFPPGSKVELAYRIDVEDLVPILGTAIAHVPTNVDDLIQV